jgi:propionyl-CoA synthetase
VEVYARLNQSLFFSKFVLSFVGSGEHLDPDTLQYCKRALSKYGATANAIDHWWQTELGWPAVGNAVGLGRKPVRPGACAGPVPGYDVRVLDELGKEVPPGQLGTLALKTPLPPGTLSTLYNNDEHFVQVYLDNFPGFYDTADAAYQDSDGYAHIVGRVDDIINTAGHRLSTGALEEILMDHPEVADCAVFGVDDELKGELPVGLVVTNKGSTMEETQLREELVQRVRETLGPVAAFRKVASVKALPKTRSGKILRATMSKIANGQDYTITPTVEDSTIFEYLEPEIRRLLDES